MIRWIVQVVLRPEQTKGFVLLKKRWVVVHQPKIAGLGQAGGAGEAEGAGGERDFFCCY
ncbi:hypothetical protein [Nostoc parmelioides]|uniref:Uncharacterized protein n=1 Tax=Nostoc parmelioides FACHB-3921 TaxID=2692909 RepID=A0ABR8BFX5_9NOSO|nr:hypothetical protein [Nostoc parmelioides]MBD2252771.1 hypothetical protein [Nostoc parmelioides FACHB-3921]